MKKKVMSVVLAAAMVSAMVVPAVSASAADDKLVVYGIYKAGDQTWFIDEGDAAKKAVEDAGGEFIYVDAKMSPEEYLKAIDNAVANNASGIITCTPDQTLSQAAVDKAKDAGIPIVACDDALQDDAGEKLAPWVGINAYVIGQTNGEWMANYPAAYLVQKVNMINSKKTAQISTKTIFSMQTMMELQIKETQQLQQYLQQTHRSQPGW